MEKPALYLWSGLGGQLGCVTGVGKHVKNMARELGADTSFDYRLVLARGQKASAEEMARGVLRLPLDRKKLDLAWSLAGLPHADRWLGKRGWVYCPKEKYVPLTDHRYAVTVHDIYAFERPVQSVSPKAALRRRRFIRMLEAANIVFTVSEFSKARIRDRFAVNPDKIVVVGNGVEDGFFEVFRQDPAQCQTEEIGGRYVLFVGGLRRKKGAVDILRYAEAMRAADASVRIVVVGPCEPEFAPRAAQLQNLLLLSRGIADERMVRLVRGASVALSFSQYEGFGIPLLEAMAAGTPVIAANRASFPEVAGDAAVLLDPADSERAARTTMELVQDSCLREEYVRMGLARASRFSWAACAKRVSVAMSAYDAGRVPGDWLRECESVSEAAF